MSIYIVKVKTKGAKHYNLVNTQLIIPYEEIKLKNYNIKDFLLNKQEAQALEKLMVYRYKNPDHQFSMDLEYVSIVRMTHYLPYSEYEVVSYREFK